MLQSKPSEKKSNGASLGFEETLWQTVDKMRGHMDSAEYKHVVLGLIFLKYISDAFEERRSQLEEETSDPANELYEVDPEDRMRYWKTSMNMSQKTSSGYR